MAGEETPQAGKAFRQPMSRFQPRLDLRQSQVSFSIHRGQQPFFVNLNGLRFEIAAGWSRRETAGLSQTLRPTDDRGSTHLEDDRRVAARRTSLDRVDNALTKVIGIRGWHGSSRVSAGRDSQDDPIPNQARNSTSSDTALVE